MREIKEKGGLALAGVGMKLGRWRMDWFVNIVNFKLYCGKRKKLKLLKYVGDFWIIFMFRNLV